MVLCIEEVSVVWFIYHMRPVRSFCARRLRSFARWGGFDEEACREQKTEFYRFVTLEAFYPSFF